MMDLHQMGLEARAAALLMAKSSTEQKNRALEALVEQLQRSEAAILRANAIDREAARQNGLAEAMIDRLSLEGRLISLGDDIRTIIALADPIGEEFEKQTLPNGLKVCKRRTPIGVLGIIYESRPNVTLDAAALAIKSGNCAILRGGSEALHTNRALLKAIQQALASAGLPLHAIQMVDDPNRDLVKQLLKMHETVDLIIPRGGASLHRFCRENSTIPVITGGIGICHLFVDSTAQQEKAVEVIFNAKTQRPTVCNALDTLLIHQAIAPAFLPRVIERLGAAGVEFRLDPKARLLLKENVKHHQTVKEAQEEDWDTEWLALILGIAIVSDVDEAIRHIQRHSTGHSDGILTEERKHAETFTQTVDSAAVYVNASTRFTDGGQLGLGAEAAISTQKLHARGPMGLRELSSYKWMIEGDYHVRK